MKAKVMSKGFRNRFDPGDGTPRESRISGRRFVVGAITGVLLGTALIAFFFRAWRRAFQERMELGNRQVVAAIEPLAAIVPNDTPAVDAHAWKATVEQTQGMLRAVVASNLLDNSALIALGTDLRRQVAAARPETVRGLLSKLWDDIARRAGPIAVKRHAKPTLLQPQSTGSLAS